MLEWINGHQTARLENATQSKYGQPKVILTTHAFKVKQINVNFINYLFGVLQCEIVCMILPYLFIYSSRFKGKQQSLC